MGNAIGQTDSWERLLQVLVTAEEVNLQTDVVLGNMLASSSGRRKNWCTSLHVLQFLFHRSIEPDAITCSSLAAAYGYLHHWQHSLMTIVQMGYLTRQADLACLGTTLDACVKSFAWEIASILTSDVGRLSRSSSLIIAKEAAYLAAMEGPSKASQWMLSVQQLQELNWGYFATKCVDVQRAWLWQAPQVKSFAQCG